MRWQKSSFSTDGNECIELARSADHFLVRESDAPDIVITTSARPLRALTRSLTANLLDHPAR
ncbi:hypothetical protein AF335_23900 [Streptomyces eurocidicus]|uniref:DUF397 domain-containing protein n=1 Tax=Streptomyces eurocidicus TaxID=66423 RepID=A0A2N8NQT9_STREU|nr:DUF397 domain-containing protein [Streptomyces eurocidicus]MBB5116876.1 hypothetical protein [Streptomyces eurocidicus]MBF6052818.1 DUF397 domain-containing protein [Streptomyces eurocidicus]PNE31121.1 hypothetical protein AF335_23900 [Streptomyces eurocidicus]